MKTYLVLNCIRHVKLVFVFPPNTTVLILIYIHDDWLGELTNVSLGQTVEAVLSLEQKIIRTAALSDAERFSEIPYSMEGSSNASDDHHHAVAGGKVLCSIQL